MMKYTSLSCVVDTSVNYVVFCPQHGKTSGIALTTKVFLVEELYAEYSQLISEHSLFLCKYL